MKEKQVSREDLKLLNWLTKKTAELQVKYADKGFDAKEIAGTFAKTYQRQLERALTPEIAAKIAPRSNHQQSAFNVADATNSYCLILCSEFMRVVTDNIKKNKKE